MQLWQDLIGPWFQLHVHAACLLQVRMSESDRKSRFEQVEMILAKPWKQRTSEEHRLAWQQYWEDNGSRLGYDQEDIDVDLMLAEIYSNRTRPNIYADPYEAYEEEVNAA